MNTPHKKTTKKSQFQPMGTTFAEEEKRDQSPMTDNAVNTINTVASYIPTPIDDEQSNYHLPTPRVDNPVESPFAPPLRLPVTGRQSVPPMGPTGSIGSAMQLPMTGKQSVSQFKMPATPRQSINPVPPAGMSEQGTSQFRQPIVGWQDTGSAQVLPPVGDWQSTGQAPFDGTGEYRTSQFQLPVTGQQGILPMPGMLPVTGRHSQFQLPVTGRQDAANVENVADVALVPPRLSMPSSIGIPAYQPAYSAGYAPVTDQYSVPSLPSVPQVAPAAPLPPLVTKKPRAARMVLLMSILLIVLLGAGGATAWEVQHRAPLPQLSQSGSSQVDATPALNSITNNTEISPLLFGTNMALFSDAQEQILHSAQTRQLLKDIGVRLIRMPTRPTLSDATEMAAAQAIKEIGAVPLVVIAGPGYKNGPILQTDQHWLALFTKVFGTAPVYFEFGNESDLAGVTVEQYVALWNQVVPALKQQFPTARFIGPDNYQFTRSYLKTFLQQAMPLPDGVSWHEYACSITWPANFCLDNIDAWNVHFAQARLVMQEAIGKQLPIWVTEWNYASDTNGQLTNDGQANNLAFMQEWTVKAMQTLIANRIFAAMQYFATDTPMPLILNNHIGVEGQVFQQEYKQIMVDGITPPMEVMTYPTPTKTVSPGSAFSFENGSTDGWMSFGAGISPAVNSTAEAFDGTHSLAFTLTNASENNFPYIAVDANQMPTTPKAGQLITAYLYVADKAAIVDAKIFVANTQHAWLFANTLTLTPGQWNKLWFGLPVNFSNQVSQIGIQFFTDTPGVSTTVYVDAIGWQ
jgi:hypothetical protein